MSRPSFQFYPADWRNNAKLRRCSWAARGVWIDIMGLMHDSDEYGVLRWPLQDLARAVGAPLAKVKELQQKGVLYGLNEGLSDSLEYRPKSGRVEGENVTLLAASNGPIWYSPRMVKDEYLRQKRGNYSRFSDTNQPTRNPSPKGGIGERQGVAPKPDKSEAPTHREGDGSSSSPSSSRDRSFTGSANISEHASVRARTQNEPSQAALVSAALRRLGMTDVHPSRPELLELIDRGASTEQLLDTATELIEAKGRPPKLGYLAATLRGRAEDMSHEPPPGANTDANGNQVSRRHSRHESAHERIERMYREGTDAGLHVVNAGPADG